MYEMSSDGGFMSSCTSDGTYLEEFPAGKNDFPRQLTCRYCGTVHVPVTAGIIACPRCGGPLDGVYC